MALLEVKERDDAKIVGLGFGYFEFVVALRMSRWKCSVSSLILILVIAIVVEASVQFSSVDLTLRPYGLQHARPSCPSPTLGVYSNSCPFNL